MLEEKILGDYKQAMKDKDALKVSVLSFLRASLKNAAIDKRKDILSDEEVIAVIKKQVKQRQDSIEQFKQGGRLDLYEKEIKEKEVLESYLPVQLSEEQIRVIINEVIASPGTVLSIAEMGKVMKEVMAKAGSAADGKLVSNLVREALQKK
ncbi:MAG: GatB/YqeY domain-containing protein [Candidatus Omnitrophota bacterium]|nr:GatB/YqeY domain-containing protein [Candidatus Omnitrophota bacterium]